MIRMAIGVVSLCIVFLPTLPAAQGRPGPQTASQRQATEGNMAGQRADSPPRTSPDNRWRYSFRNGHWWYYRDGGRWAYWTGKKWRDYEPEPYHRWYVSQKMAEYEAELARFDAGTMRAYRGSFQDLSPGFPGHLTRRPDLATPALPRGDVGGGTLEMFTPRPFDGRLNPPTSTGGYMGGALRGPFGY